ncbi:MAG: 50S ribosomal protein L4 [Puniceicoccales bacterium]|jgi:large subunit ribosomal protein L4|nr:50S ribosomal protein L4 [Puniceicoccales bacterium]
MDVDFFTADGTRRGKKRVDIPACGGEGTSVFLRHIVLCYQNNFRQDDASTKSRAEVSGSGKKPYRQKGTGMARHGERRSPIWRGGGVVFGPKDNDHSSRMNLKERRKALAVGLSVRAMEGRFALVENFPPMESGKTKDAVALLDSFDVGDDTVLFVDSAFDQSFALAMRNIPNVYMLEARTLNVIDVVAAERIFISEKGMAVVSARVNHNMQK